MKSFSASVSISLSKTDAGRLSFKKGTKKLYFSYAANWSTRCHPIDGSPFRVRKSRG